MDELTLGAQSKRPQDYAVDVSTCAEEPIRIPGEIQPHGYLLVVSQTELKILQVSENITVLLGCGLEEILNKKLENFVEQSQFASFESYLRLSTSAIFPFPIKILSAKGIRSDFGCIARRDIADFITLELEPLQEKSLESTSGEPYLLGPLLNSATERLHQAQSLSEAIVIAAAEIRNFTSYDRVMVYKFDKDWHGEVIAESRLESLEPFLGLHYPASDIPEQARELYLRNLLRLIVDVDYNSVAIHPPINPITSLPLDMSDCVLRSVSPIHIEYLQNMGVRATLVISIVIENELWGMISCQNHRPTYQPPFVRAACKNFAQSLSLKILGLTRAENLSTQLRISEIVDELLVQTKGDSDESFQQGFEKIQQELETLFKSNGVSWILDDEIVSKGDAPDEPQIISCLEWLRANEHTLFSTDHAESIESLNFSDNIAGFLAIRIGVVRDEWLIFFRLAQLQLVRWAGNPEKAVVRMDDSVRLHPRGSFKLWVQEVSDRSLPWSDQEKKTATILQAKLLQLKQKSVDRDIKQQKEILRERNDFVASLAHDLKNPVLGAMKVLQLIKDGRIGRDANELSTVLQQVIEAHEMLLARIKAITLTYQHADGPAQLTLKPTSLHSVLEKAVSNTKNIAKSEQKIEVDLPENELYINADEDALCRVFENLIANAINHTDYNGSIKILLESSDRTCSVRVIDSGSGISSDDIPFIFNRSWRGRTSKTFASGFGLGLHICSKIVKAHRGSITCNSELGKGSEFLLTFRRLLS